MDREKRKFSGGRKYSNGEITVYWKPSTCVHASYCYRELIEVFDPSRRPWIDIDGSSTEKIIEIVNLCPTDALTWKYNDEERNKTVREDQLNHVKFRREDVVNSLEYESEEKPVSVKVMEDGPLVINGNFTLTYYGTKKDIKDSIISLCRCGNSDRLPFCDGRHRKVGFIG